MMWIAFLAVGVVGSKCWADCYRDESEIKRDTVGCPYREDGFPISHCRLKSNGCEDHCRSMGSSAEQAQQQSCKAQCTRDGWGMQGMYVSWKQSLSCDRYCIDQMSASYVSPNARGVDGVDEFYPDVDVDALPIARGIGSSCQQDDDCLTGNCYNNQCARPRRGRAADGSVYKNGKKYMQHQFGGCTGDQLSADCYVDDDTWWCMCSFNLVADRGDWGRGIADVEQRLERIISALDNRN